MTGIELTPDDTPGGGEADCLQTASNLITLNFDYGSATQNNGNIVGQTIGASAAGIWQQYYTYDGTNRLAMASENAAITGSTCPAGATWCQKYGYDHFGNRWISASLDTLHMATPTAQSAVSLATNRLTSGTYDAAGNLTAQAHITTGGGSMAYDANNKMKSFTATGVSVTTNYDTAGRRVRKIYNGKTTIWVYDAFGNLAAEYTTETQTTPAGTYYRTTDHLGSTRLVTDGSGQVRQRHDFFPFGEQIPASASFGNRQNVIDGGLATYNASLSIRQQFTGQQRDEETGLDYFWARNMAAPLGRFLSRDPENAGAGGFSPQTWNAYGYGANSPLRIIDPDGRCGADTATYYYHPLGNLIGVDFTWSGNCPPPTGSAAGVWWDGLPTTPASSGTPIDVEQMLRDERDAEMRRNGWAVDGDTTPTSEQTKLAFACAIDAALLGGVSAVYPGVGLVLAGADFAGIEIAPAEDAYLWWSGQSDSESESLETALDGATFVTDGIWYMENKSFVANGAIDLNKTEGMINRSSFREQSPRRQRRLLHQRDSLST